MAASPGADRNYVAANSAGGRIEADARLRDGPTTSSVRSQALLDLGRVIQGHSIESIDFRFTNVLGHWCSFTSRIADLDLSLYKTLGGFRGQAIPWSRDLPALDPLVVPDFESAFLDPFADTPTLVVTCNVHDLITRQGSTHDSRSVAQRIETYIQSTHIGGSPSFTIEIAGVRAGGSRRHRSSDESGPNFRGGGQPVASGCNGVGRPFELHGWDPRAIIGSLESAGIEIKNRDTFVSGEPVSLVISADSASRAADRLMFCKYVIDRLSRPDGSMSVLTEQGSAFEDIHILVCQRIWRKGRPLFAGDGHGGTSAIMRHYAAGLVEHTPALLEVFAMARSAGSTAFATAGSTVDSEGAQGEFNASNHVSLLFQDPKAMSVTFACPSVPSNPYLALAGIVLAGIDGFNYRIYNVDPNQPLEKFFRQQASNSRASSGASREFLFAGGLFTPELLSAVATARVASDKR